MPILRINGHLVYYCHVPKAAGTAMEAYLREQFGVLAFANEQFYEVPAANRWTRSSPQHVDVDSLGRLFPAGFFDEAFAVVRDPVARIVSAYKFQKLIEGLIPPEASFDDWVLGLDRATVRRRFAFDNHLLPMYRLVPEGSRVFRLEDGLGPVIDYLRGLAGPDAVLPDTLPQLNVMSLRLQWMGVEDEHVVIGEAARRHIADLYREDYERFGYALPVPAEPEAAEPMPAEPEVPATGAEATEVEGQAAEPMPAEPEAPATEAEATEVEGQVAEAEGPATEAETGPDHRRTTSD